MPQRSYRWLLLMLALTGFIGDQASKYGVFRWLYADAMTAPVQPPRGERDVIPGWFKILAQFTEPRQLGTNVLQTWSGEVTPRVNHGALFGIFSDRKDLANYCFAAISCAAAIGILVWGLRKTAAVDGLLCTALGLILGGTLGNLYDRLVFGGVRDFLYFYWFEFPVFNVADCCLVVGAFLLLTQALWVKPADAPAVPVPAG